MRIKWVSICSVVWVVAICASFNWQAIGDDAKPGKPKEKPADSKFAKSIKPLLKKHCIECHGAKKQESGLRLDRKTEAMTGGDSGPAIIPGDGEASLLVKYISGDDPERIMPPEGDPLTEAQVTLFREWIDDGAKWPEGITVGEQQKQDTHWAYKPLGDSAPPKPADEHKWVRNPIDAFVLAKLLENKIKPSPEADRTTLIRRLSLDLIGLPPTPTEVEAFINDTSADAYEKVVNRLLKSPHFGEFWGRHWLDKARYADSDGYEKDRPRMDAWRYRDWVINAINNDMPFDQFTIEQLAGDMLPSASDDQRLATAFHRQTLTNTEGGTDREQWRVEAVFDRVETIGTVWLGLTVGCARCHSHKYDQLTQREYYQLFAFLNNGDETNTNVASSAKALKDYEVAKAKHDAEVAPIKRQLDAVRGVVGQGYAAWETDVRAKLAELAKDEIKFHDLAIVAATSAGGAKLTPQKDGSYLVSGPTKDTDRYEFQASTSAQGITGFRLLALADKSLPKGGPGRADNGNFVVNKFEVSIAPHILGDVVFSKVDFKSAIADFNQKDWEAAKVLDGNPKTGWAISPQFNKNHHITFMAKQPLAKSDTDWDVNVVIEQMHGSKHTLGRFKVQAVTGQRSNDIVPDNIRTLVKVPDERRSAKQKQELLDHFVNQDASVSKLAKQLADVAKKAPKSPMMSVRVISERGAGRRVTRVMRRGDFLQPMDEVQPNTVATLHPIATTNKDATKKDAEPSRLDFARWLMSEQNPLTPRVLANQVWANLFGTGLVTTLNDFGVRGERPSHPRLLDWLGGEYRRLGWSRKAFVKTVVMSATYRQSSHHRPELSEIDATNRLLARQNRVRLRAESIRDYVLAVSGLLSHKVGGPSVFPAMPPDVAALSYANNFKWNTSKGEDQYRRGMYTFFKRTAPHPNLTTFDCPDSNTTCVERRTSNTPLQALTVLNNQTFVEAAQSLAARVIAEAEASTDDARINRAFQVCVGRAATSVERDVLTSLVSKARAWYGENEDAAKQLAGSSMPKDANVAEFAAWVATARIVLNMDELIMRE